MIGRSSRTDGRRGLAGRTGPSDCWPERLERGHDQHGQKGLERERDLLTGEDGSELPDVNGAPTGELSQRKLHVEGGQPDQQRQEQVHTEETHCRNRNN